MAWLCGRRTCNAYESSENIINGKIWISKRDNEKWSQNKLKKKKERFGDGSETSAKNRRFLAWEKVQMSVSKCHEPSEAGEPHLSSTRFMTFDWKLENFPVPRLLCRHVLVISFARNCIRPKSCQPVLPKLFANGIQLDIILLMAYSWATTLFLGRYRVVERSS